MWIFSSKSMRSGRAFWVSDEMTSNNSPAAKMLIIQFTSSDSDKCTECLIYIYFTSRRQSISIVHFGTPIAQSQLRFSIELKTHDETHICRQRRYFTIVFVSDFIQWAAIRHTQMHSHRTPINAKRMRTRTRISKPQHSQRRIWSFVSLCAYAGTSTLNEHERSLIIICEIHTRKGEQASQIWWSTGVRIYQFEWRIEWDKRERGKKQHDRMKKQMKFSFAAAPKRWQKQPVSQIIFFRAVALFEHSIRTIRERSGAEVNESLSMHEFNCMHWFDRC